MDDNPGCGRCVFYAALNKQCRKNPPEVFPVPGGPNGIMFLGTWPPVEPHNWCGEFVRRIEVRA